MHTMCIFKVFKHLSNLLYVIFQELWVSKMRHFATRRGKNPWTPLISREKIFGPPLNFREKIKGPPPVNLVPPGHISIVRSLKHILRVISSPLSSESVNRYIIWCISVQLGTWGKLFLHNGNLHRNTLLWASEICFQIPSCYHRRYYPHMTDFEPLQK